MDTRFSDPNISEIAQLWRTRQDLHRAEKKLTLQVKAICRRYCAGDKGAAEKLYKTLGENADLASATAPFLVARSFIEEARKATEKNLRASAKLLPIYPWTADVRGLGELGLAAIVGECGDLSAYKSVSAVWKRCGLAVIDGRRQRRVTGDDALVHGYAPERRSVIWTLADSMLKAQGKDEKAGPYRRIYDARKAYERPRVDSDGHAHKRALRYMTKELLKDMTSEWRKLNGGQRTDETHTPRAPVLMAAE